MTDIKPDKITSNPFEQEVIRILRQVRNALTPQKCARCGGSGGQQDVYPEQVPEDESTIKPWAIHVDMDTKEELDEWMRAMGWVRSDESQEAG